MSEWWGRCPTRVADCAAFSNVANCNRSAPQLQTSESPPSTRSHATPLRRDEKGPASKAKQDSLSHIFGIPGSRYLRPQKSPSRSLSLRAKRGNLFSKIASVYPQAIVYSRLPQSLALPVKGPLLSGQPIGRASVPASCRPSDIQQLASTLALPGCSYSKFPAKRVLTHNDTKEDIGSISDQLISL